MKKILAIFIGVMFISAICLAQTNTGVKPVSQLSVAGKVLSASLINQTQGVIEIVDTEGGIGIFATDQSTRIYDTDLVGISLDKVMKNSEVKIEYIETENKEKRATSIAVTKK